MTESSRLGAAAAALALAGGLTVAGCGGSARPEATTSVPRIPVALAGSLAARADRIAAELRNGDGCAAAADAVQLRAALERAAAAGAIPRRLQAPALTAVARLQSRIVCSPATTATTTAPPTTAPSSCAELQARRQQLEQEKRALDQRKHELDKRYKGKAAAARKHALDAQRHALDQAEHALDKQLHGCH